MLHALDRQKIILDNLKVDSVTSINHLIQKTKFHESTIRRDLKILDETVIVHWHQVLVVVTFDCLKSMCVCVHTNYTYCCFEYR